MRYHVIDPEANGLRQTFCKRFVIRGSSTQRNSYSLIDRQQSREYALVTLEIRYKSADRVHPAFFLQVLTCFRKAYYRVSLNFFVLVCGSSKPHDRFSYSPFGYSHESQKSTTNPTFSFTSYQPEAVARNCRNNLRDWIIHYLIDNPFHSHS
jgi:hypothetical protein